MKEHQSSLAIDPQTERLTLEDAKLIQNVGERMFALAVLAHPHLVLYYQPCTFQTGDSKKTVPDYFVVNTRNPKSVGTYIEVTSGLTMSPRKDKQLGVMNLVKFKDKNIRYLQFNGPVLAKIQNALFKNGLIDEIHPLLAKKEDGTIITNKLG